MTQHRFFVLVPLLVLVSVLLAKPTVRLFHPRPGMYGLERVWRVEIRNPDAQNYFVRLRGEITEEEKGVVFTGETREFEILARQTKVLRYGSPELQMAPGYPTYAKGYDQFAARTGGLPPGDYTFRVWLLPDFDEGTIRFRSMPAGPPRLVSPRNRAELQQEPVFTWTPPMPRPSGMVSYTLKLVEVLTGQSVEEALKGNPAWFMKRGIRGTTFRYPVSGRRIEKGRKYAWQVTAEASGIRPLVSEKWGFGSALPRPPMRGRGPFTVEREVERYGNWFRVELRIVNTGNKPVSHFVVMDSSRFLQCIDDAQARKLPPPGGPLPLTLFNWEHVAHEVKTGGNGFSSAIEMDLGSWALQPGHILKLRYSAVPIIHNFNQQWGKPLRTMLGGPTNGSALRIGYQLDEDQHCRNFPGLAKDLSAVFPQALGAADYLIVTVPRQLFGLYSAGPVTELLVTMAKLARAKNGVLGFSEPLGHVDLFLLLYQGGRWANRMNPAWATTGYLLLVGEGNVVPHWPTLHNVPDRPIRYSDHMFSNLHWSTRAPRLKVGRIVGRTADDLRIGIQNSLDVYYHVAGADYSGTKAWIATGLQQQHKGDNFTVHAEQGAQYLRDHKGMTCAVWGQEFITTRERVVQQALRTKGRANGGAHPDPDTSNLNVFALHQLAAWLLEITVGLPPPHAGDQAFTDSEGVSRRVPYGFDQVDVANAVHQAEDIENARRGPYPKAYVYAPDWNAADGLIDNVFGRDLPKHDVCFWSSHGYYSVFDALHYTDVAGMDLRKHGRRPVVVSFGCYNGEYFSGSNDGIVRAYLKSGGGAFFGYTQMTSTGWFRDEVGDPYRFLRNWFPNRHMGTILKDWKAELSVTQASNSGDRRMLYGTNLYGDPKFGGN